MFSAPYPTGGAYSAPADPNSKTKGGLTSVGREGRGELSWIIPAMRTGGLRQCVVMR